MKIRKIMLKKVWLSMFIFLCIFAPPILPINILFVLSSISLLFLLVWRSQNILFSGSIYSFIKSLIVFLVYVLLIMLLNMLYENVEILANNRVIVLYQLIILIPLQLINISYILEYSRRNNFSNYTLINLIISAGILQAVIALISFLLPNIRTLLLDVMSANTGKGRLYNNDEFISYRGYGFAETLLDTFGYGMGLIAGYCVIIGKEEKYKYYFYCIPILFAIMINSRTGLLIFILSLLPMVINSFKPKKIIRINVRKSINGLFMIVLFCLIGYIFLQFADNNSKTFNWILSGFRSISDFFTHQDSGYSLGSMRNSLLDDRFWQLPSSFINLLFGSGHSIFGMYNVLGIKSDVGYVNYIWISGVLGLVWICSLFLSMFFKAFLNCNNITFRYIVLFNIISFFVMMIKGNIIGYNAGTFITLLITFMILFHKDRQDMERINYD